MTPEARGAIRDVPGGCEIAVRVSPGARRERLLGWHGDALKLAVRAPPERGRANRDVERLLGRLLGLAPRAVEVVAGHTARDKRVRLRGPGAAEVRSKLERILVPLDDS